MMGLPIEQMLNDASEAHRIRNEAHDHPHAAGALLGAMAGHVRELAAALAEATHERDTLIAAWPFDSSGLVIHRFSDGKFVAWKTGEGYPTLEAAVRAVVFDEAAR